MLGFSVICFSLISLLHLVWGRVIYNRNDVFLEEKSAGSFLSRKLLYNSWDFELVVPDNLQRECMEEICSYEEAREVFEDDIQTAKFWEDYVSSHVFLEEKSAGSFLSRKLLYNSWDFELVVPDNLQRECMEEICSYEEAREVFEDDIQTAKFWEDYVSSHESSPPVDVSGLVAGIVAIVVTAIIATVLGIYCYKNRGKNSRGGSVPVRMGVDGQPHPESVPLSNRAPGLPSYNEALAHSGQHDAPPPPYSGGNSTEPPQTQEEE